LLSLAFAGTLVAIFYTPDGEGDGTAETVTKPRTPARAALALKVDAIAATAAAAQPGWIAAVADPFATKGWQPPPPVVPPTVAAPAPVAMVDLTPPPPPPLPFKFVGQMNDGTDLVIYLSSGDQVVLARQGDVLDGGYKVSAISPTQIEFESVSSGLKQPLAIPAKDN
jgi:hypothetical protein